METSKITPDLAGKLVITEKETSGLEEKWFNDSDMFDKTIHIEDNITIPKHTIGFVVEVIDWVVPAMCVCWGGTLRGRKLVITHNKATLLDDFIEKLDHE